MPSDPDSLPLSGGGRWPTETVLLCVLFGALYFTQGVSEPTEGLVVQPTRWLLKSWGETNEQITSFAAWITLPWLLKPLYGLVADFLPLGRNRRKNYLILTTAVAAFGFLALYFFPPGAHAERWLFWALFVPTVAVAFTDVVVDALMIGVGQPRGITGHLQSVQWTAIWAATILNGELGGIFSDGLAVRGAFLLCSLAAAMAWMIACSLRDDPPPPDEAPSHGVTWRETRDEMLDAVRHPVLWLLIAFLVLWNFTPLSMTVVYLHWTRVLGFDEVFYGHTVVWLAAGAMAASLAYGLYCRRVTRAFLMHLSIVLGIAATWAYWMVWEPKTAGIVSALVGFTHMTATLILLDLAAQICPVRSAGTVFGVLMAVQNGSVMAATWWGGELYDAWLARWGAKPAFQLLVGISALPIAACWLLVPRLKVALSHTAGAVAATVRRIEESSE
ncbi:MAG TPA: MFS transporter [Pirellulales bacterium]|nr:MFS transporter [Pirellulales bacterium]